MLFERTLSQLLGNILLATVLFFLTTTATSYITSLATVAQCTACSDGKRNLSYNEVNYDLIFLLSLFIATTPMLIASIRRRIKKSLPIT